MSTSAPSKGSANAILMYHGVATQSSRRFRRFVVSPALFEEQMEFLAASGLRGCGVSELVSRRAADDAANLVGVTFDDAFAELLENAVPILTRLGFGATVYVPTAFIGGSSRWLAREGEAERRVMTVAQLRELVSAGIECGAHGHLHLPLDEIPIRQARHEIETSKNVLEAALGADVRTFAYPFGYERRQVRVAVAGAGFESACRVGYDISRHGEVVHALSRVPVPPDADIHVLARLLTGDGLRRQRLVSAGWRPVRRTLARVRPIVGQ